MGGARRGWNSVSVTLDANVLIYGSDPGSPFHQRAKSAIEGFVGGDQIVYAFWPVLMAYLRVSTHPRIFGRPLPIDTAMSAVRGLIGRSNVRAPGEDDQFWKHFQATALETPLRGNLVPDAHLVALMRAYGVNSILTHDRDFRKFDGIKVIDPFA